MLWLPWCLRHEGSHSINNLPDPDLIPGSGTSPGEGNGYPSVFLPREFNAQRSQVGYSLGVGIGSQRVRHDWATNTFTFMVFPVVMYGCESWTINKVENWRIDAFELWCRRRLLRFPWTARRSNQLILKEISPEYSLEGLMLKLKLQYFGHLMQIANSMEKTWCWERLKTKGEGDNRWWDR